MYAIEYGAATIIVLATSAGVTITTALVSVLTGRPIRHDLAMTGEVTLRGNVLAVGGIKEKVLAARRAGVRTVLIPQANAGDLAGIPANYLRGLEVVTVSNLEEVLEIALLPETEKRPRRPKTEPASQAVA